MALERVSVALIHAHEGWRAIYAGADGELVERPVLGWSLAEVRGGTSRNPHTLDTEVRAILAKRGPVCELADDGCLGYAAPGEPASSFTPGATIGMNGHGP